MLRRTILKFESKLQVSSGGLTTPAVAPIDALPTASEAPHLLEAFQKPKPFFNAKSLQSFTFAVFFGSLCVGSVYYLLSRSLAAKCEEEMNLIKAISMRNRRVEERPSVDKNILPPFVVPRTYDELAEKMKVVDDKAIAKSLTGDVWRPLLHQEAIHRLKVFWNEALFNVQVSLEATVLEWREKREIEVKSNIERALGSQGLELTGLRRTTQAI